MSQLRDRMIQDLKLAGLKFFYVNTLGYEWPLLTKKKSASLARSVCPKCHGEQTRQGLEKRQAELLPCDYFHGVATVPSELHDAFRGDQKFMYGLDALKKHKPDLFATIPAAVWQREWVSFLKHYGHGNDAVLNYLSRYVFRTAIGNTRIDLPEADRHVRPAEDRGPTRNIGPTDGTLRSSDQPRG